MRARPGGRCFGFQPRDYVLAVEVDDLLLVGLAGVDVDDGGAAVEEFVDGFDMDGGVARFSTAKAATSQVVSNRKVCQSRVLRSGTQCERRVL
jgi:hypothetical protein